ncbi:MAG: hypothetical protein H6622_10505 [Halobacteriovoraceae bacterium]|nr:hypothetical protein [Halobacteriovoraceae bacterium]
MKFSTLSIVLIFVTLYSFNSKAETHICYFSLNNEKEYQSMRKFIGKLTPYSSEKITVSEYQFEGSNPNDSFEKLVNSGVRCDGLVISGHHTGSFGGKRGNGQLELDFLESLSCNSKYRKWFENISALWLQGCRTLGSSEIVDPASLRDGESIADSNMERVTNALEEDNLDQNSVALNLEFSATMDQDNPLSSRYLRIFPNSTVFGWSKSAPGAKSKSENSIPYHIAHITRLTNDNNKYFMDPIKGDLTVEVAVKYSNSLLDLLNRNKSSAKKCLYSVGIEQTAIDAWLDHGQGREVNLPFSFNNPDLMGFPSLAEAGNPLLEKARTLNCLLKDNTLNDTDFTLIIDSILSDERLIGYNFSSLWAKLQQYQQSSHLKFKKFATKLKESTLLNQFVFKKIMSNRLGILRKIDYYAFYKAIYGDISSFIDEKIRDAGRKMLLKLVKFSDHNRLDFQRTLMMSLTKNDIFIKDDYQDIVKNSISPLQNTLVAFALNDSKISTDDKLSVLNNIIKNPISNALTLEHVTKSINKLEIQNENTIQTYNLILDSSKTHTGTYYVIISSLLKNKNKLYKYSSYQDLLKRIKNSKIYQENEYFFKDLNF